MAQPAIQTSFASGEWAPKLQSRVDIQKYHSGAALLRNFYVDYSGGGASTRQGTKWIAQCGANGARLIPFQPSTTVSYVLEFGQNYIRFCTNGGQVLSAPNTPYQIASPYNASDLFPNPVTGNPGIKFVQDATSLIICHPNYAPQILTVTSATNWTLTAINFGSTIATPTGLVITSTDTGSTTWYSGYLITAVDINNQESAPTAPQVFAGTNQPNGSTAESYTLNWNPTPGAQSYNVYKAAPSYKATIPTGAQYGFVSNVTGTQFIDSPPVLSPDFSQTPPVPQNPFQGAGVASYAVTVKGAYTVVPTVTIAAPPAGGYNATAIAQLGVLSFNISNTGSGFIVGDTYIVVQGANTNPTIFTITVTSINGFGGITGANVAYAGSITSGSVPTGNFTVVNFAPNTANAVLNNLVWGVVAVLPISAGAGYTTVPTVTFSTGIAVATATLSMLSAGNPGVPGFLQERLWLANQPQAVQTVNISQPGSFFNFNTTNPTEDDDGIQATIIAEELNDIRNLTPVPTGMIAFTGKGAWLLNGGGGISTMNPITPANITAQPQAFNGANDMRPIKINFDALYVTNKGNYVRDLTYNLYAQIFTGSDISVLANHLFFNYYLVDWCWAEEPFKTLWSIRNDGTMLSLGFVKEQELIGWGHHDTNGQFLSVCSVIETVGNGNVVDAVYVIVQRTIGGNTVQYVERMADRYFVHGYIDSWSVDCGLQTVPVVTSTGSLQASGISGSVTLTAVGDTPFTSTMVADNYRVDSNDGAVYEITAFTSSSIVTATVIRPPTYYNKYTSVPWLQATGQWFIWQPVTAISGLTQLEGMSVVGVADGAAVGPLTVSNTGTVTLATAASKVTLGLAFTPQLQTLPLDLGEPTVQGKNKKITGVTLRVADTLGLSIGHNFDNLVTMKDFQIGAIPSTTSGVVVVSDLVSGVYALGRTILDPSWNTAGSYCIQQNLPYPATILGCMPEVTVGDSAK